MDLKGITKDVRIHPRITQQGIEVASVSNAIEKAILQLKTFRERAVHAIVVLVDWDHRLPSKLMSLRMHVCYDQATFERFDRAFVRRGEELTARDKFPEFDVPDYSGLLSDEDYDIDLTPKNDFETMRLTSPWRREVDDELAQAAVEVVRNSEQFAEIKRTSDRSPTLGEPEPVGWAPPCETGQAEWLLDIWWLTAFDGRMGRGWSFLVNMQHPTTPKLVVQREFAVRAG